MWGWGTTGRQPRGSRFNFALSSDVERVLEAVQRRQIRKGFSRVVGHQEIEANDFDLSPSRYLEPAIAEGMPIELESRLAQLHELSRQKDALRWKLDALFEQARTKPDETD